MINIGVFLPATEFDKFSAIISDLVAYPDLGDNPNETKFKLRIILPNEPIKDLKLDVIIVPPCKSVELKVKGLHNETFSDNYIKTAITSITDYCLTEHTSPIKVIAVGNICAAIAQYLGLRIYYELIQGTVTVTDIQKGMASFINGINVEVKSYPTHHRIIIGKHILYLYKDFGYFMDLLRRIILKILKDDDSEERSVQTV